MFRPYPLAFLPLLIIASPLAAQQPTSEQREAIRSACRADFIANCSEVKPGSKEALECLLRIEAKLAPACKTALSAVAGKPGAPAAGAPGGTEVSQGAPESPPSQPPKASPAEGKEEGKEDQLSVVRQACTLNDFVAHCSWIQPSSPEVLLCLQANVGSLSPPCQAALQSLPAAPAPPAAAETAPAEPAPAAPAAPAVAPKKPQAPAPAAAASPSAPAANEAAAPSAEERSAVRAACRSDFVAHCPGVKPGGAEALQCLERNAEQLSPRCRSAVAAIGKGAPAGGAREAPAAAISPSAPAANEAAAPSAEERSAVRAACRSDFMARCPGVQPGGAEALQCLQRNAAQLSPRCRSAVAAIGKGAPAAGANEAPAAAPAAAAAPMGPMPEMRPREALAILRICGADARIVCGGIPPGGGRIIACLAGNAASLSPGCRAALSAAARR